MAEHGAATHASSIRGFDRALLTQSPAERVAYFARDVTILHPRQEQAYLAAWRAVQQPAGITHVFVVGPSGVGKTTLLRKLRHALIGQALAEESSRPVHNPICSVVAESPHTGTFNWGRIFRDMLQDLDEPCIEAKIAGAEITAKLARSGARRIALGHRPTTDALREAVEQAVRLRQPRAMCIDEAHHLAKVGSARRIKDQADCLKSLADRSGRLFLLLGTYELLPLRKQSDQLSRRTLTVHFPRYTLDGPGDVEAFKRCLVTFEQFLPVEQRPDLLANWDYLFTHSVGCIGTLKDWLTRALSLALREVQTDPGGTPRYDAWGVPVTNPARTITRAHLEQTALPTDDCLNIASLATLGEAELRVAPGESDRLHDLLHAQEPARRATMPTAQFPAPAERKRRGLPGRRTPHRDPIGAGGYGP
jgi:hypothetical protein